MGYEKYLKKDIFKRVLSFLSDYRIINLRNLYASWEEYHLTRFLKHFEVDCVFDVGANVGQYATMLRHKAGYKGLIISFEPIPDAILKLKNKSKYDPKWIIEDHVLSTYNGFQKFHIMEGSQFSSLSEPSNSDTDIYKNKNKISKTIEVKCETLERAFIRLKKEFGFKKPFLKLDTQGYDLEIVSSSEGILSEFVGLQSELAIKKLYEKSTDFKDTLSKYEQYGFKLSAFVPNNVGSFPSLIEIDCIMYRDTNED